MRTLIVQAAARQSSLYDYVSPFGHCDVVTSGRQAVEAFNGAYDIAAPYDLILFNAPGSSFDPQKTLLQMRRIERERGIQRGNQSNVIMATSLDIRHRSLEAFSSDYESYLEKPITRRKLYLKLQEMNLLANGLIEH